MKQSKGLTIANIVQQLCERPYIVLPVHLPNISHWILVIIHNARAFYVDYDDGLPPCIFALDSLQFDNSVTRNTILAWFKSIIPPHQFTRRSDLVSVDLKVRPLNAFWLLLIQFKIRFHTNRILWIADFMWSITAKPSFKIRSL